MSVESTQQLMDGYFDALLTGGDFARFFGDEVVWITTETGDRVVGRDAVRDFIVAFHTESFEARPEVTSLVVADGHATLEADFVGRHAGDFAGIAPTGAELRVPYCVCYDVEDGEIVELRAYMPIARMINEIQAVADKLAASR